MYKSNMNSVKEYSDVVSEFLGLNERTRGNENEFADMVNMSSDCYPLLSPRPVRATAYETENVITALKNKEALLWCEKSGGYNRFFDNAYEIESFRSTDITSQRQIVGMGAYAVLFPDKKYVNLLDYSDNGSLGHMVKYNLTSSIRIQLAPCTLDDADVNGKASTTAPAEPKNGDVWIDTSSDKSVYKKWDAGTAQWVQMSTTYVRLRKSELGKGFSKWDTVTITGLKNAKKADSTTAVSDRVAAQVKALNLEGAIIFNKSEDSIIISGILDEVVDITSGEVSIERKVPDMDFVIECNNRLWGCKYGMVGGKVVNEIYCCRQGDFKNWYAYLGVATDSYAVTVGSEGAFTGAAVYNRNPIFFKQDCIHQIYGSSPSSFQLITTNCEGVEKGQGKSVCVSDNVLYYKGPTGFFAYTGSLPQKISRKLKNINFEQVIAEGVGDKVYFACGALNGAKTIYVYDTYYGLWHKEDSKNVQAFSRDGHILYMLVNEGGKSKIMSVTDESDISIEDNGAEFPKYEDKVKWCVESTDIGYGDINAKYIKKLIFRLKMAPKSKVKVLISCDAEPFRIKGDIHCEAGVKTDEIAFSPERCEFFRYRIEGEGAAQLISVKKKYIQGSEKP